MKLLKALQKTLKPVTKMVKKGNKLTLLLGVTLLLGLILLVKMYMNKSEGFNTNDYTFDNLKIDIKNFGNNDTTTIRIPTNTNITEFGTFAIKNIDNKKNIVFKKHTDTDGKPLSYISKGNEYGSLRIVYEDNTKEDIFFYYINNKKLTDNLAYITVKKIIKIINDHQNQEGIKQEQIRIKNKLKDELEITVVDTNTVNNVVGKAKTKYNELKTNHNELNTKYDSLETVLKEQGFIYRPPTTTPLTVSA